MAPASRSRPSRCTLRSPSCSRCRSSPSLRAALDDVLHVPYRRALVSGYDAVTAAARDAGAYGATLSGSGPTILAVAPLDCGRVAGDAMLAARDRLGVRAE